MVDIALMHLRTIKKRQENEIYNLGEIQKTGHCYVADLLCKSTKVVSRLGDPFLIQIPVLPRVKQEGRTGPEGTLQAVLEPGFSD